MLSRLSDDELESLFEGYGYKPHFVSGDDPMLMHKLMAKEMDKCVEEIKYIWHRARDLGKTNRVDDWPMIVLRTPKDRTKRS